LFSDLKSVRYALDPRLGVHPVRPAKDANHVVSYARRRTPTVDAAATGLWEGSPICDNLAPRGARCLEWGAAVGSLRDTLRMNFDRYCRPIAMSDPGRHVALFDGLPRDAGALAKVVQDLLIHQHIAPAYGVTLSCDQQAQSHVRAVEKILDGIVTRDGRPL